MRNRKYKWDLFLSHASEDRDEFIRPLAERLNEENISFFYDEFVIDWGDSIRESIDKGLKESRFAVVILSKHFFKKDWTNNELNGYFTFDSKDAKRILPIWHKVDKKQVKNYSPILADRVAIKSDEGIDKIVEKIKKRLKLDFNFKLKSSISDFELLNEPINWETLSKYTISKYGFLGIDEFWQAALLDDLQANSSIKKIKDIDLIIERVNIAVSASIRDNPLVFKTGTDFITKSLGFGNEEFRNNHQWATSTRESFERYKSLIKKVSV